MRQLVEDRVWIATDESAAPGTLRAFLSDGTLVMTSCGETYRLAPWRWVEDARAGLGGGRRGAARRGGPGRAPDAMASRSTSAARGDSQSYRAAEPPEVCPDLPR